MPTAKPRITRTFGPIHFEDLDPHRFEDLIRELIYDFKDWQSIEATGRGGSDDGFDIRAYEKAAYRNIDEIDVDELVVESDDGNLWMIQGKREKEIGPAKLQRILDDIDAEAPPYGYILAASADFSKRSYDVFRDTLRAKGVTEFYLWGKAFLEDILHMPKYDRILFTFFGVSLVSKRKSRATELRSAVTVKNKLLRTFAHENTEEFFEKLLIRDLNDEKYPFNKDHYSDFDKNPRWKEYTAYRFHPHGLVVNVHEYFAYVDTRTKQFDYWSRCDLANIPDGWSEEWERWSDSREGIDDFWERMPSFTQGHFVINGLLRFDDIAVVDDKGDSVFDCPHIYVDYKKPNGPFSGYFHSLRLGEKRIRLDDEWERVNVFPDTFLEKKSGRTHVRKKISLAPLSWTAFKNGIKTSMALYDLDGQYSFLKTGDMIEVINPDSPESNHYIEVTSVYDLKIGEYLDYHNDDFGISRALGEQLNVTNLERNKDIDIAVYEYRKSFRPTPAFSKPLAAPTKAKRRK